MKNPTSYTLALGFFFLVSCSLNSVSEADNLAQVEKLFPTKKTLLLRHTNETELPIKISDFQIAGDKFYILDDELYQAMVFNQDGSFQQNIGQLGPGPGEYRYPGGLCKVSDRIHILAANRRYNIYDLEGTFIEVQKDLYKGGIPNRIYLGLNETAYFTVYSRYSPEASIYHVDKSGVLLNKFSAPDAEFITYWDQVTPCGNLIVTEDVIIQNFMHRYQLLFFSHSGTLLKTVPLASDIYIEPDYKEAGNLPRNAKALTEFRDTHTTVVGLHQVGDNIVALLRNTTYGLDFLVAEVWDGSFKRINRFAINPDEQVVGSTDSALIFYRAEEMKLIWRDINI